MLVIFGIVKWYYSVAMCIPLIIDGSVQYLTKYESTNIRRCVTGILLGIATIQFVAYNSIFVLRLASNIY